jgi:transcriptional adapter 2-alpha
VSTAPRIKGYNSFRKEFETDYDENA